MFEFDVNLLSFQSFLPSTLVPQGAILPCVASDDSFLEYGQNAILSTGNFLCSATTANSTMDFSTKPVEDGVVDSPPNGAHRLRKSCSPLPLRSRDPITSRMSPSASERVPQRKLYEDFGKLIFVAGMESAVPEASHEEIVQVPSQAPALPRPRVQSLGVQKTKTHEGEPPTRCDPLCFDAWDQKFIQMKKLQQLRQYKKVNNGYSRGPEIMKATEMLKSTSHM